MRNSSGGHFPEVLLIHSKWLLFGFITDSFDKLFTRMSVFVSQQHQTPLLPIWKYHLHLGLHALFSHAAPLTLLGLMSVAYAGGWSAAG